MKNVISVVALVLAAMMSGCSDDATPGEPDSLLFPPGPQPHNVMAIHTRFHHSSLRTDAVNRSNVTHAATKCVIEDGKEVIYWGVFLQGNATIAEAREKAADMLKFAQGHEWTERANVTWTENQFGQNHGFDDNAPVVGEYYLMLRGDLDMSRFDSW